MGESRGGGIRQSKKATLLIVIRARFCNDATVLLPIYGVGEYTKSVYSTSHALSA